MSPAGEKPAGGRPAVEVLTIGEELLLGETVDTNAAWLGRTLAAAGVRVVRRSSVGDEGAAIRAAVAEALARTGTVICSGGLGPTSDDVTKRAVAELFGRTLKLDEAVLHEVTERFRRRGFVLPESSRGQAEVPEGAHIFANARGTAPGLALEDEDGHVAILLPGVPHELRGLVQDQVLDYVRGRFQGVDRPIEHRMVRSTGLTESETFERAQPVLDSLAPLTVAFLPGPDGVDLRVTSWGDLADARQALAAAAERLAERLGHAAYTTENVSLADVVGEMLRRRSLSLAVAESCTGGLLGKRLTDRPGASDFFLGGVISYADAAKVRLLDVSADTLAREGAVSRASALEMAEGVRRRFGADAAIAITGIAGPSGGSAAKPVGTVWLAASVRDDVVARQRLFGGSRDEIRQRAAQAALDLLRRRLQETAR